MIIKKKESEEKKERKKDKSFNPLPSPFFIISLYHGSTQIILTFQ